MTRFAAAAAAFVLAFGVSGAASAEPSPRARELAHRYIAVLDMKKSVAPMMDNMLASLTEQELAGTNLTPEQRTVAAKAIRDAFNQSVEAGMFDRMMVELEPLLAETFTEEELEATIAFYESGPGRSMLAKMPMFGQRWGEAMVKFVPELQADLQRRIRENLSALHLEGK
ncbi:hypothetical protein AS593_18460 [Caulobacter vibrioides]|nr:hypothetical protein AS593_18460 [Caulobacter vibrioides]